MMAFKALEVVVLAHDMPSHGLRAGDLGTVVEVYSAEAAEVEFVSASGETAALVTLSSNDVRAVSENDLIAVRPLNRSA